ncbi:MAG: hypothetical protein KF847_10185 [Pirellulales bacterium]|nr:hypothetical protein [Pirellulales bacterium]
MLAANAPVSHAALLSAESFSDPIYVVGSELPTLNPSVAGYTGPWTDINFGDAEAAVMAGTLNYGGPGYAAGAGNKIGKGADAAGIGADNSGRVYRTLDASIATDASTNRTIYLSWLYQNGNENAAAQPTVYQTLSLYSPGVDPSGDGANRVFDAGTADGDFGTTNYAYRVNNTTVQNLGVPLDSGVHLFVAKFELSSTAASDSVTVWLDPALGGVGDPAGGFAVTGVDLQFDTLALSDYASNSVAWDEIRWGDSFADVTTVAVPEPCAAALLATVIGIFVSRSRRRRIR